MARKSVWARILADERGTSAIEYGLICAMIVIGLISAVSGVASETTSMWNTVSKKSEEAHSGVR